MSAIEAGSSTSYYQWMYDEVPLNNNDDQNNDNNDDDDDGYGDDESYDEDESNDDDDDDKSLPTDLQEGVIADDARCTTISNME